MLKMHNELTLVEIAEINLGAMRPELRTPLQLASAVSGSPAE